MPHYQSEKIGWRQTNVFMNLSTTKNRMAPSIEEMSFREKEVSESQSTRELYEARTATLRQS